MNALKNIAVRFYYLIIFILAFAVFIAIPISGLFWVVTGIYLPFKMADHAEYVIKKYID